MSPLAASSNSEPGPDPRVWVVILAGGVGSRFWPVSTPAQPKQLLPIFGPRPLLTETVARARPLVPREQLWVLTGQHLVEPIGRAVPELTDSNLLVEPQPRGTGPVLTWAAFEIQRRDAEAILVSLHADHVIEPVATFRDVIRRAVDVARRYRLLVTVAVEPTRPETGYGYIQPGEPLEPEDGRPAALRVAAFVEKPDPETAAEFVRKGYLWNSGLFVWPVTAFLDEVRLRAPELGEHIPRLERGDVAGFFARVPVISVDEAVLERSPRVAAVRATFRWDDVGTWEALARVRAADEAGNVSLGEAYVVDGSGNIVYAGDRPAVLFGVSDLIVVRAGGATFVTHRTRAPELKRLLARLPEQLREMEK